MDATPEPSEPARAGFQATRKGPAPSDLSERTVFREEGTPGQSLTLKAAGEVTDDMLEALEDYVKRQRKRLSREDA